MHPRYLPTIAALFSCGIAFGQSTLDWTALNWSNGTLSGVSYNVLSGAGSTTAAINVLTYDFGNGLTATVSASRDITNVALGTSTVRWQDGTDIANYGTWAPGVTDSGVLGLGISNGSPTAGATFLIHFNQAVTLGDFRIGDLDRGGSVLDSVVVSVNSGGLLGLGNDSATVGGQPSYTGIGTGAVSLTGIDADQGVFGTNATRAWIELNTGSTAVTDLTVHLLGGTGNHGIWISDLSNVTAIPEPSTYAVVLGLGTLGLVVWRRRARR